MTDEEKVAAESEAHLACKLAVQVLDNLVATLGVERAVLVTVALYYGLMGELKRQPQAIEELFPIVEARANARLQ